MQPTDFMIKTSTMYKVAGTGNKSAGRRKKIQTATNTHEAQKTTTEKATG
jgi:hypothetical protein